jgi:hypothetical protein
MGTWQRATVQPIRPSVSPEKVWADLHHDSLMQTMLRGKLIGLLATGELQVSTDEELWELLFGMDGPKARALRGSLTWDNDLAWALGFGTVRERPTEVAGYLYGLFEVGPDGVRGTKPVAVFRDVYVADDDPSLTIKPTFEYAHPNGVRLEWNFPSSLYEALGLRPFGVAKEVIGPDGDVTIVELGHALMDQDGDTTTWHFADSKLDRGDAHTFHLTTRSFVTRDRQTSIATYDPDETREKEEAGHPMKAPTISEAKQLENGDVAVTWDFQIDHEQYIAGFELQRREGEKGDFVPLRRELSATTRHILDTTDKRVGETYSYKLLAFRIEDQVVYGSQIVPLYITDMRRPAAPKDLKAVVEITDGKRFVVLSWAPPEPGDTATHRWVIDSDEGSPGDPRRQASISPLESPSYRYPIETIEARPFLFRVIALSRSSLESEPSEVRAEAPGAYLVNVVLDRFELIDEGRRLRIHWRFPKLDQLVGFYLYVDGDEVLNPERLGPDERAWETERLAPGDDHRYNVQAVSRGGLRSHLGRDWSYRMPAGAGLPMKPLKLSVRAEPTLKRLRLVWARIPDGLTHVYVVRVKPPGQSWRAAGTIKGTAPPTWAETGVETPGPWEFEVRGQTVHGLMGPAATLTHQVMPVETPAAPAVVQAPTPEPESDTPWLLWGLLSALLLAGAGVVWSRRSP